MAVFAAQHHHQSVSCDTLKMNQLCKVCGEPAAGFHFGAFTCEGCKSFFGRSYNNLSVISECKNGGQCVINKKNRTSCKACRLRKCLLVGMSKSGSRYGRRSNWFKLHCLMQEQAPASAQCNTSDVNSVSMGASAAYHGLRRSFHPAHGAYGLMSAGVGNMGIPSSMSSNESKNDDVDECKNSTSPSVSSPGSHRSDSSLELEAKTQPWSGKSGLDLNPYGLKLGGGLGSDFFPPLGMPMLPPHLQAAAAAAAAAANLHNHPHLQGLQGGFFPPNLPAPRLLFPGISSLAFPTSSASRPKMMHHSPHLESKKFNIESMLAVRSQQLENQHRRNTAPEAPEASSEAEQDSPMDLSVKAKTESIHSGGSVRNENVDSDDPEFDESDTINDDDEMEDDVETGSDTEAPKPSHPLDLTRK